MTKNININRFSKTSTLSSLNPTASDMQLQFNLLFLETFQEMSSHEEN